MTTWLIDKSALVRLAASPDAAEWAVRIERGLVRLAWHCRACDSEWPVTRGETNQLIGRRRSGVADRRRRTRTDRRTE